MSSDVAGNHIPSHNWRLWWEEQDSFFHSALIERDGDGELAVLLLEFSTMKNAVKGFFGTIFEEFLGSTISFA